MPLHWLDEEMNPLECWPTRIRALGDGTFYWQLLQLPISPRHEQHLQRPLSPAPQRPLFETSAAFRQERARWYREHGDGTVLQGTLQENETNRIVIHGTWYIELDISNCNSTIKAHGTQSF